MNNATHETALIELSAKVHEAQRAYLENYEPNEFERSLIEDAISGLESDTEYERAYTQFMQAKLAPEMAAELAKLREENERLKAESGARGDMLYSYQEMTRAANAKATRLFFELDACLQSHRNWSHSEDCHCSDSDDIIDPACTCGKTQEVRRIQAALAHQEPQS